MMKLQKIYRRLCLAAWSAGLLATLQGCVFGETVDAPQAVSGDTYTMSITVLTRSSAATRANHTDDGQQAGSEAENHIDFEALDFSLVLFDKNGNFIQKIDCNKSWKILPSTSAGSTVPDAYLVETELKFPETMTEAAIEAVKKDGFQVMALANWNAANGAGSYAKMNSKPSLADIWQDGTNYNFGYNYTPANGSNTTWQPNIQTKKLIPMFGFAQASAFKLGSNSTSLYSSAMIPMQRAMAKVEVIDGMPAEDGFTIQDVTMTTFNTSARFIPNVAANPDWDKVGSQVESSSLPNGVSTQNGLKFVYVTDRWVAYVPEMALGAALDEARPHLNVSIGDRNNSSKTYPLHFAQYADKVTPNLPDESWHHILRNHIYRYTIERINADTNLTLQYGICKWTEENIDIPTFD